MVALRRARGYMNFTYVLGGQRDGGYSARTSFFIVMRWYAFMRRYYLSVNVVLDMHKRKGTCEQ